MFSAKFMTSAGVIAASLLSSVGVAAAAGFSGNIGAHSFISPSGQTVNTGGGWYVKNDGTTATFGRARGVQGSTQGYAYGKGTCTKGVSCSYNGQGTNAKGSYTTAVTAVNNNDGTWTVTATANITNSGGVLQTKTKTWTIYR